jgi:hypothetical protein
MNGLLVGLVLAAAGSTEVDGAITATGQLTQRQAGSVSAGVHGRVDVARDFGRFFVAGRASLLITGSSNSVGLRDLGSRLTLGYRPAGFVESVFLEVLPFNSSVRLPYFDWANVWAQAGYINPELAPTLTAQVETKAGAFWLSARFKTTVNPISQMNELVPDLFAGASVPFSPSFRLELRGAYLNRGLNPVLGTLGLKVPTIGGGGGARLSWTWNELVGPAVDFVTYSTDPLRFERFFAPETRRSPFAAWIALEGGAGAQQLADPGTFGEGKLEPMGWADLQARVRLRDVRLFGTARFQSLSFVAFDWPGLPPFTGTSSASQSTPLFTGIFGADWTIRSLRLTPGLLFRVTQYASQQARLTGGNNPPPGGPTNKLLVGPNGWISRIPIEEGVRPVISAKVSTRWDLVSFASLIFELEVTKDFNDTLVFFDPEMHDPAETPASVNGQLFLQARF